MDSRAARAKRRKKVVIAGQVCYGKAEARAFGVLVRKQELRAAQQLEWQLRRAAQARRVLV